MAVGRPKGRTEENNLREPIILRSCELFGELGYGATSLRAIAKAVGITAPALYNHFSGKNEILFACLEYTLLRMVNTCEMALAQAPDDPVERLSTFVDANTRFQLSSTSLQFVYETTLFGEGRKEGIFSDYQRNRLRELQRRHLDNLRSILSSGEERGVFDLVDLTATAFSIFALGEHLATWYKSGGRQSENELCKRIVRLSLRMAGRDLRS